MPASLLDRIERKRRRIDKFLQPRTASPKRQGQPDKWEPIRRADGSPSPQRLAYDSPADELYYGGGAGGGKSDLLLGLALTAHRKSIIFRRQFTQLTQLEDRLIEIVGGDEDYNRNEKRLRTTYAGGVRSIEFGAVQRVGDWMKYQGRPHDLVAFDELPHFLRSQYRPLIGWLRTEISGQRCRVVCAGNPPTDPEGEWVIEEWAPWLDPDSPDPAEPGELRWYRYADDGTEDGAIDWYKIEELQEDEDGRLYLEIVEGDETKRVYPRSRTFIPALVDDNPFYMATGYDAQLEALPEPLRSLMRRGMFGAGADADPWQVIPTAWVDAAMDRWKGLNRDGPFDPACPLTALGIDPSRGGRDATTIAARYGTYIDELSSTPGAQVTDGPIAAALVINERDRRGGDKNTPLIVDVIGIGSSVYDHLPENSRVAFNASEASTARDRTGKFGFRNQRSEGWWKMRERLDPEHGDEIALPPSRTLRAQLTAPRFRITATGIEVEPKLGTEHWGVKQRLGRSTDDADAIIHAFYVPARKMPSAASAPINRQSGRIHTTAANLGLGSRARGGKRW